MSLTGRAALLLLPLAGLLVGQARADVMGTYGEAQTCGMTVFDMVGDIKWPGGTITGYYGNLCTNPNPLITLYANMDVYCQGTDVEGALDILRGKCRQYGPVEMVPASAFAANLTADALAALPVRSRAAAIKAKNATAPFLCDEAWFALQFKTDDMWGQEERHHAWYTIALYIFWCVVIGLGMIQNAVRKVVEGRRGYVYVDAEGQGQAPVAGTSLLSRCDALVRKYVTTPSALPPYHSQRLWGCTIPTRMESFIVATFWIINIVLCAVNYSAFEGNLYWSAKSLQLWRYVADRTGYLSYGNIPLMYMFSGRNNIFMPLTGWSYGTFNIFHRHIARISTVEGIVHSIAYTGFYFANHKGATYRANYAHLWWSLGVGATFVMSFLVLFSFSVFRARLYENFLLLHIALSAVLLAFLWYIFALETYNHPFLTSAGAVWALDRVLRLVRQAYVNLHVRRRQGSGSMLFTDATVTYHADADMLVVDTVPGNPHLFPGPGQHYYLYQPLRLLGWENHPFTLAAWTTPQAKGDDTHLQFWVRPYDGWTKQLRKECEKKGTTTATTASLNLLPSFSTKMLLEGPYGKREPVHCFEEVLLVAGGSGIAGVLPYVLDFVRRADAARPNRDSSATTMAVPTRTRRLTLVWADRREAFLRFVADGVLADLMHHSQLDIRLHLTSMTTVGGAAAATTSTASSSTEAVQTPATCADKSAYVDEKTTVAAGTKSSTAYRIHTGRPDVLATVDRMAAGVCGTEARLAVMMCGPNKLADEVRRAVVRNMETKRDAIEYFEESFGW